MSKLFKAMKRIMIGKKKIEEAMSKLCITMSWIILKKIEEAMSKLCITMSWIIFGSK